MGMMGRRIGAGLLVAAMVGLVSCGAGSDGLDAKPRHTSKVALPSEWLEVGGAKNLPPLTAALIQLEADLATIENAATLLAAECMASAGFTYEPTLVPVSRDPNPFGAGDLDPEVTANEGYGDILGAAGSVPPIAPIDRYERSLPATERARFERTLMGTRTREVDSEGGGFSVPEGGCLANARRRVGGNAFVDWAAVRVALEEVVASSTVAFEESTEWVSAEQRWSACMADHGYHYAANGEAILDALARFEGDEVDAPRRATKAELDMATTDARCRRTARFNETIVALEGPLERESMNRVEAPLLAWLATRTEALGRAEVALRRGGNDVPARGPSDDGGS